MRPHVAVVYSPDYLIDLGGLEKLHSFDVNKYGKIVRELERDGLLSSRHLHTPEEAPRDDILRVHTARYLEALKQPQRVAEYLEAWALAALPASVLDEKVLRTFRLASGGTVLAARLALACGIAVNIGGGYHHARPDAGGGFNIYNDIAIAIRRLQSEDLIRRSAVVDLDVHQGNGTAVIFSGDDDVFTFSMHEDDIFPIPKARSDLDVGLPAGADDAAVLGLLQRHLGDVLKEARPDIVFYQAGCDTFGEDPLANVNMTEEGIVARDAAVVAECVDRDIPVVMTLGGGYAPGAWHVQHAGIRRLIKTYGLAD